MCVSEVKLCTSDVWTHFVDRYEVCDFLRSGWVGQSEHSFVLSTGYSKSGDENVHEHDKVK